MFDQSCLQIMLCSPNIKTATSTLKPVNHMRYCNLEITSSYTYNVMLCYYNIVGISHVTTMTAIPTVMVTWWLTKFYVVQDSDDFSQVCH